MPTCCYWLQHTSFGPHRDQRCQIPYASGEKCGIIGMLACQVYGHAKNVVWMEVNCCLLIEMEFIRAEPHTIRAKKSKISRYMSRDVMLASCRSHVAVFPFHFVHIRRCLPIPIPQSPARCHVISQSIVEMGMREDIPILWSAEVGSSDLFLPCECHPRATYRVQKFFSATCAK